MIFIRERLSERGGTKILQNGICGNGKIHGIGSLRTLSDYLSRYYGKKVIILLDEYDTSM